MSDLPAFVPVERRRSVRFSTTVSALISVRAGAPMHSCTIVDVSLEGCRIRLDTPTELPDYFVLFLTSNGTVQRRCKVIWRRDDLLGVAFIGRFNRI